MDYYTSEKNAQIVVALLKSHKIRKIIASPGTTNICLVASLQHDPFFEIYSAPEERSAGYMACGLAAESGEPVVITCTGATASRNYMPALTEAFYRKLPILAITCSRRSCRIGHNFDQVTDRTVLPNDVAKISVQVPLVYDYESEWADIIAVNKALLELTHNGNGPVHINLETNYSKDYTIKELPVYRAIHRYSAGMSLPTINAEKVAIFVGAHVKWSTLLTNYVEKFCEMYNGVVLCDHISNYKGRYAVEANLMGQQTIFNSIVKRPIDLLIYIGDVFAPMYPISTENVWRVNPDGELRDPFRKLRAVFEMQEEQFFKEYTDRTHETSNLSFWKACSEEYNSVYKDVWEKIETLPFGNSWVASQTSRKLPENSVLHLGIQNSLRFWNFFPISNSVCCYCNTGGFGIDGSISSTIGASLCNKDKLYYCVLGDLAFFYDLNALGNRHIGKNLRILLVNNGKGTEFKLSGNPGSRFGDAGDLYIAAAGHYGNKSKTLVKHFAEDLGFEYLSAETKDEYIDSLAKFLSTEQTQKSIIFEIFTTSENEDRSLTILREMHIDDKIQTERKIKNAIKGVVGKKGVAAAKKILGN